MLDGHGFETQAGASAETTGLVSTQGPNHRPLVNSSRDAAVFTDATSLNRIQRDSPLNQTGDGVVVGLWDAAGYPLQIAIDQYAPAGVNQAIDTSATDWGTLADHSEHATVIAEVLLGDTPGVTPARIGIAPDASLRVADGANDLLELNDNRQNLDLSLHPYNVAAGWQWIPEEATQHPTQIRGQFVWFGNIDQLLAGEDDALFGSYDPRSQSIDASTEPQPLEFNELNRTLTIWSAGNNSGTRPVWVGNQPRRFYFHVENQVDFQRLGHRLAPGQSFTGRDYYALQANFNLPPANGEGTGRFVSTIAGAANAKNVLTVGAVEMPTIVDSATGRTIVATQLTDAEIRRLDVSATSGQGPTDDGRIKPDLVAPGGPIRLPAGVAEFLPGSDVAQSGSSIAAAVVAGHAANLYELLDDLSARAELFVNPVQDSNGDLLKAALLHTASDIGLTGPDYQSGFGLVNGTHAAEFIQRAAGLSLTQNSFESFLRRKTYPGSAVTRRIRIDPDQGAKITLYWDDFADLNASHGHDDSTSNLINDLDVYVVGPDGTHYYPFVPDPTRPDTAASRGVSPAFDASLQNHRDNVEQIVIDPTLLPPGAGLEEYTVVVSHTGDYERIADEPIRYVLAIDAYTVENVFTASVNTGDVTRLDLHEITGGQNVLATPTVGEFQASNDPQLADSLFFSPPSDSSVPVEHGEAISLIGGSDVTTHIDIVPSLVSDDPRDLFSETPGLQRHLELPIFVDGEYELLRIFVQPGFDTEGEPNAVDLQNLNPQQIAQRLGYLGFPGPNGDSILPFTATSNEIDNAVQTFRLATSFQDAPNESPGPRINSANAPTWSDSQPLISNGIELLPQGTPRLDFGTDWAWETLNRIGDHYLTLPPVVGAASALPLFGVSGAAGWRNSAFDSGNVLHDGGIGFEFSLPSSTDLSRPFYRVHSVGNERLVAAATDSDPNAEQHHISVARFEIDERVSLGNQIALGSQLTSGGAGFDFSQLRFDGRERIRIFSLDELLGVSESHRILGYDATTGVLTIEGTISGSLASDEDAQAEIFFARPNTNPDDNSLSHEQASYENVDILDAVVHLIVSNPDLNGDGTTDDPYRVDVTRKYLAAITSQSCTQTSNNVSACITDVSTSDPRVWEKNGGIAGVDPPPDEAGNALGGGILALVGPRDSTRVLTQRERRVLLSGIDQLDAWARRLNNHEELAAKLAIGEQTLGETVRLDTLIANTITEPIRNLLQSETGVSLRQIEQTLENQSARVGRQIGVFAELIQANSRVQIDRLPDQLLFNLTVVHTANQHKDEGIPDVVRDDLQIRIEDPNTPLEPIPEDFVVQRSFRMDLTFGILTDEAVADDDAFFIHPFQTDDLRVRYRILPITEPLVFQGRDGLTDISGDVQSFVFDAAVQVTSPDTPASSDGILTAAELRDVPLSQIVSVEPESTNQLELILRSTATLGGETVGTDPADPTNDPALITIRQSDVFDETTSTEQANASYQQSIGCFANTSADILHAAISNIATWFDTLEGHLGNVPVPFANQSLGDVLDLSEFYADRFLAILGVGVPDSQVTSPGFETIQDLERLLATAVGVDPSVLNLRFDSATCRVLVDLNVQESLAEVMGSFDMSTDIGRILNVAANGEVRLQSELDFSTTLGLDLASYPEDYPIHRRVLLQDTSMTGSVQLAGGDLGASASLGLLGVEFFDGTANANLDFTIQLGTPNVDYDLVELFGQVSDLGSFVDLGLSGSADLNLPVRVVPEFLGAQTGADPRLIVSISDLTDLSTANVVYQDMDALLAIPDLDFAAIVQAL
ncbi:MAG: S8 family serine peptidase, partial [Planctomycetota bacterium]